MKAKRLLAFLIALSASTMLQAAIPIKAGEKVAFMGDSITASGFSSPGGYVRLIGAGLEANGVKVELIGAGVSGHKSDQMLDRLERDVLSKKPQWMTLSCGVNDVWHGARGVALPDYQKNITAIVDKAQAAGIKVVILTSTMITEDPANPNNKRLADYNAFLRTLATEKKCLFADLNSDMQAAVEAGKKSLPEGSKKNVLTSDGVHMAYAGDMMMATGVLKGLGLDAAEISKAKAAWLDLPNTNNVDLKVALTQRQAEKLEKVAASKNMTIKELLNKQTGDYVQDLLKDAR